MSKWYENQTQVLAFGEWLVDTNGMSAKELIGYFEKPWHWENEHELYEREQELGACPQCQSELYIEEHPGMAGWASPIVEALCTRCSYSRMLGEYVIMEDLR